MITKVKSVVLFDTEKNIQSKEEFKKEVLQGLSQQVKQLAMKYVYDQIGSKLCTAILQTQVYYIFRCDKEILETKGSAILKAIGSKKFNLVDLGAGDGYKTQILLQTAVNQGYEPNYIPLDISLSSNIELGQRIEKKFPSVNITAVTSQFQQGVNWIQKNITGKNAYFIFGATFGNQIVQDQQKFIEMMGRQLKPGNMIFVTIDLWKDPKIISDCYAQNGSQHLFILNSLSRINKQLGSNFDLNKFYGYPYVDPFTRIMQGVIVSKQDQQVNIMGSTIHFKEAEIIKCLMSKKFLRRELTEMFQKRGFKYIEDFKDTKQYIMIMGFVKV